jgi:DNA-binding transcriptional MerR regulator
VWTLDELVDRVRAALATEYPGAPNGRVRDLPDRRAIRWYATRGLVDRPAAMRGRVALYGPRHLLQLVALKRLQAAGHTLAEIQAALTGAADETLAEIALLPAADAPGRARFWAEPPAAPAESDTVNVLAGVPLGDDVLLILPTRPGAGDVDAIRAAAEPLLTLLDQRGLLRSAQSRSSS